jgi:hypothetical protein
VSYKLNLGLNQADIQATQLICECCGQPYYPDKSWQDQLDTLILGEERFAICPICTQSVPEATFNDFDYRKRCLKAVKQMLMLYRRKVKIKKPK